MQALPAKNIDRLSQEIEKKYKLQNNNPKGHNRHTSKKELVRKEEILSELKQFENLNKGEQYDFITKMGNDLWREGKDYRAKKSKFTQMQKLFFGWDWKED